MKILTYKRTHIGDPDINGTFGINNCMGQIRKYDFDAVIGVGGVGQEPKSFGIDKKINWVGINARKIYMALGFPSVVNFEYFVLLEEKGPLLDTLAPNLANRLYNSGARFLLNSYSKVEEKEAHKIIKWALKIFKNGEILSKNNHCSKRGCSKRGCKPVMPTKC